MHLRRLIPILLLAMLTLQCREKSRDSETASEKRAPAAVASPLQKGERAYVHAADGLVLRQTPAKDGKKIATLPYAGAPLEVLEPADNQNLYVAEEYEGWKLTGGWVKVRNARGQEGYAFERYLSRYSPMTKPNPQGIDRLDWAYHAISTPNEQFKTSRTDAEGGYVRSFQDGTLYESAYQSGGATYTLSIPASVMRLEEALVIFRTYFFAKCALVKTTYEKETLQVSCEKDFTFLSLRQKGDRIEVTFSAPD